MLRCEQREAESHVRKVDVEVIDVGLRQKAPRWRHRGVFVFQGARYGARAVTRPRQAAPQPRSGCRAPRARCARRRSSRSASGELRVASTIRRVRSVSVGGVDRVFLQRRMHFDQQLAFVPAPLVRLVHDRDRRADRHHAVERFDVLRIEPHAAVRHLHADARRPVGAVDQVGAARNAERHLVAAHRIVRTARNDRRKRLAALLMLLANRFRRYPGSVLGLGHDPSWCRAACSSPSSRC